jgi:hypothetical protein
VYSPKIREDLIPRLHRLKTKLKRPMTHLVAEALTQYLGQLERRKENPMCAKKNEEDLPVDPIVTEGQTLEATVDIFYVTAEGMESHLQIKGTSAAYVLAESQTAIQAIVEAGGKTRTRPNGRNGRNAKPALPYYTDEKGVKRCNRMTVEGERCGERVTQREGKYGVFWSCKNYKEHAKTNDTDD